MSLAVTLIAIVAVAGAGVFLLRHQRPVSAPTPELPPGSSAQRSDSGSPASVDTASIRAVQNATTLNSSRRYAETLELVDAAVARDSTYDQLFLVRGVAYRGLRQFDRAVAAFGKAIALAPGASKAYLYRGIVYTDDLDLYDRGIQDFRRVLELDPGSTDAMVNIGVALYKAGRNQEAIRQYSEAIPRIPTDGRVVYLRGLAYRAAGDLSNAYADMVKARSLGAMVDQKLLDSLRTASGVG